MEKFPRASHLPAAFCPFPDPLLVLFYACFLFCKALLPYNLYEFWGFVNPFIFMKTTFIS